MRLACLLSMFAACLNAQQPASLDGAVSNAVTGQPLRYVHVSLSAAGNRYGAITTAEGHFSIASIPPGAYTLSAQHTGYLPPDGLKLTFQSDERKRNLEVKMMPAAVISGRVVDDNGDPVDGAKVTAIRGDPTPPDQTNDNGEFRLAGLRPGKYLLQAARETENTPPETRSDGTKEVFYGPTYYPGVAGASMALAVEAKAGAETTGIEIRMVRQPILRVSGRVTGAAPKDRWNAWVLGDSPGALTRLQPDGSFTIWRMPPGPHRLTAEFNGTADQSWRSAPLEIVVADSHIDHLELAIVPPFEITGKVPEWNAQSGKLHLMPLGRPAKEEIVADIAATGAFKLEKVQPDQYRATIPDLPDNVYIKRLRLGVIDTSDGILDVRGGASGESLSIELATAGARITGTVSDANGPVPSALVALFPEGRHRTELRILTRTARDGTYSIRGLPAGKYTILTLPAQEPEALARYDQNLEKIELAEGDAILKDLMLPAGR